MNDVKNIIGLLCKHLNTLVGTNLKSEHFHLAKFNINEDNVVPIFWNLLNILTINVNTNIVDNVKMYFKEHNYLNPQFYLLPENMTKGSRELLISFCYIFCKKLNSLILNEFEKSSFNPKFNILCYYLNGLNEEFNYNCFHDFKNNLDYKHYVKWINGRIEWSEKMMKEYDMQNNKLLKKLKREATIEDLSSCEIVALNNEKYGKIFLKKSDRIIQILENHSNWLKKESLFWKWMDTVLLEKDKEIRT